MVLKFCFREAVSVVIYTSSIALSIELFSKTVIANYFIFNVFHEAVFASKITTAHRIKMKNSPAHCRTQTTKK